MNRRGSPSPDVAAAGRVKRAGRRVLDDPRHDPYEPVGKYREPTRCGDCGAVYRQGRWQWREAPAGAAVETCPACRRIRDDLPAGWLVLGGPYAAQHRDELLALVRHEAEHERIEHPQNRILRIDLHDEGVEIATTDIHLPQRLGRALKRAHGGELAIQYGKDEYSVQLRWTR